MSESATADEAACTMANPPSLVAVVVAAVIDTCADSLGFLLGDPSATSPSVSSFGGALSQPRRIVSSMFKPLWEPLDNPGADSNEQATSLLHRG